MKEVEPLRFSLVLDSIPVILIDTAGIEHPCELRAMDGRSRDTYMNSVRDNVLMNSEGKVIGFKTFEGMQSSLLKHCFYDEENKLVPEKVIQTYPAKVLSALFEEAQKLNGLEIKEPEKND